MAKDLSDYTEDEAKYIKGSFSPHALELTVLPTEKCNFRCTYCYEDFKIGKMSARTVAALKALIDERSMDLQVLRLNWFGGEPLLASDIVLDVASHAHAVCSDCEIDFFGEITTNGYLLDLALLERLTNVGMRDYQISIDGDRTGHNETRILGSGAGTYDEIMANLMAAHQSDLDFHITLRVHITRQNIGSVERAISEMQDTFGADDRFSFFIKAIENLGGGATVRESVPDKGDARDMRSRMEALLGLNRGQDTVSICYASRPNAFVIRADGTVGKCTVLLNADSNRVGNLNKGGEMQIDIDRLRRWMTGYDTLDRATLHCPADALNMWSEAN
ncbi:radical SAM protein [Cognatiyoonia sp. IB215446]|uniref:radical SAM protein n=1 Tax=Cognatiyoonia sp. IB215446 TaxID=3097355 RepID=UPI002A145522|nr:radical SAM protein [Cognatiyoonia sp. IB215446]MDX8346918.1 radical SAM protein [Cognatiyoonia sp. IB215446]